MTPHPQFVKHRSKFFAIALVALGLWILVPVAVVMVKALLPAAGQADLWQHLWAYQLPRLLGNTVFLMMRSTNSFTCVTFKTSTKPCSITSLKPL